MSAVDDFVANWAPPAQPTATPEQEAIVERFAGGDSFKVEAGAGTGKTTTLGMLARATDARGQYLAFNKAIVVDAGAKMSRNVACSTAHSLAYQAVGHRFRHRLGAPRMRAREVADILGLRPVVITAGGIRKRLEPWQLAGIVGRTVTKFCQSADTEPGPQHMPHQEGLDHDGEARGNLELAHALAPAVRRAWADLVKVDGHLQYRHEHYLKLWQLSDPRIATEFVLFDEVQDANAVMAAIVDAQTDVQKVYVGDSAQQINAWMGAVNSLARVDGEASWLTQSWRFGPAVATVANRVLEAIGTPLRLVGHDDLDSRVLHLDADEVDAVLCRTNARAVEEVIDLLDDGRRPALVGGGENIVSFARGAADLQDGRRSTHPELACFDTWAEVVDYVTDDAQGHELKLLVDLVKRFGARRLMAILLDLPEEAAADVVVSTAHKAKGREWATVRLCEDLGVEPDTDTGAVDVEELRLLYVAVTRARETLDLGGVVLP